MTRWDKSAYVTALRQETRRFRDVVAAADADLAVPSCPEWNLGQLTGHLSLVFQRLGERVTTAAAPENWKRPDTVTISLEEFDAAFERLALVLERLELDDPAWNPAPLPNTARFWFRRAGCETAVHRWDAQMAVGSVEPIDASLATEGIDEAFDAMLPSGRRREKGEFTGLVRLAATDVERDWFVRLRGERLALLDADSVDTESSPVHARAAGTASDLMLALWGRVPFGALDTVGSEELLSALRIG